MEVREKGYDWQIGGVGIGLLNYNGRYKSDLMNI
jgi:hypothetical protein